MNARAAASLAFLTCAYAAACGGGTAGDGGVGGATSAATTTDSTTMTTGTMTSTGPGPTTSSTGTGGAPPMMELVHRIGRFDDSDPNAPGFTWSGTSLSTVVNGTGVSVNLDGASKVFFETVVDGASTGRFETNGGPGSYPVATGLAQGMHSVEIFRRNEGFFGTVAFGGFVPEGAGSLVESPVPYIHRLEFIGDSLTCGYGDEGMPGCNFSGDTENAYLTYGAIAARNLNAAAHLIAYSGKGVHQNYGGDMNELMPELYERTLTNTPGSQWDFTKFAADAVVVNLGTNDFSAPLDGAAFQADYVKLLKQVRAHHPGAPIFCVKWATWGKSNEALVDGAVMMSGEPNVTVVEFTIDAADGPLGCDGHPNLTTHAKMGALLTGVVKQTLGW